VRYAWVVISFLLLPAMASAASILVENEKYVLSSDAPDRWIMGTHLKGCCVDTALPGCLVPGSVIVKLADGTVMQRDKDYLLDEKWASLSRIKDGRIGEKTEVLVTYRVGQLRVDAEVKSPDGKTSVIEGKGARSAPMPPEIPAGTKHVANILVASSGAGERYPILEENFPEPDAAEMQRRSTLVPKTLAKLRAGEPLTLVAWGDSVTSGGSSSTPEKAFAPLFASRLGERFPKSKIKFINAGIGGTNTVGRLPALQTEVIAHHPDRVTIEFVNDMGIDEKTLRANYKSAFEQIRAVGAEAILITPHFTMPELMGRTSTRGPECRPDVELLRKIAAEHNVALADASKRWEHLEAEGIPYITLLYNGINHPDDRGHEMFVKELLTFFPN
jgi:lysophospholipase L1-like esterase